MARDDRDSRGAAKTYKPAPTDNRDSVAAAKTYKPAVPANRREDDDSRGAIRNYAPLVPPNRREDDDSRGAIKKYKPASDVKDTTLVLPLPGGTDNKDGDGGGSGGGGGGGGGGGSGSGGGGGGGSGSGGSGDNTPKDPSYQLYLDALNASRVDAFKLLEDAFTAYGLEELIPTIRGYMTGNIGPNEATLLLKQTDAYKKRFAGNEDPVFGRRARKLNVYSEAEYLAHENEYAELFQQYGQNQFANRAEFAQLIGNNITKTDLNERLNLAVINVQNADPNIKAQLKQFYPNITDADLVSYFLKPDQTIQSLQLKVSAADVGAAARAQGLSLSGIGTEEQRARAEQIATYLGPTSPEQVLAAARQGFEKVATVLPPATKLTDIYGAQTSGYRQTQAESEFLMGDVAAARARLGLSALETAQFSGQSGIDMRANPLAKSIQGSF